QGIPTTGLENYGGPLVTANGLLFIAATKDGKFRAFNRHTGKLLWETTLPASGFATPATYSWNGKQYIVIACGGTKLGTAKGNQYVAFALPLCVYSRLFKITRTICKFLQFLLLNCCVLSRTAFNVFDNSFLVSFTSGFVGIL